MLSLLLVLGGVLSTIFHDLQLWNCFGGRSRVGLVIVQLCIQLTFFLPRCLRDNLLLFHHILTESLEVLCLHCFQRLPCSSPLFFPAPLVFLASNLLLVLALIITIVNRLLRFDNLATDGSLRTHLLQFYFLFRRWNVALGCIEVNRHATEILRRNLRRHILGAVQVVLLLLVRGLLLNPATLTTMTFSST